jgi:predicted alpha-1,2-mannosidase
MRGFFLVLLALPLLAVAQSTATQGISGRTPYDAVNPFIGTAADGNTFPAATLPFGMIQWGPDTRADGWYHYGDKTLRGFSLTHISGAGCPLYADVPVLPWTGEIKENPGGGTYALGFAHDKEQAHPGYYAVETANGVRTELAAGLRAGMARFVFPEGATRTLLMEAGNSATVDEDRRKADTSAVTIKGNTVTGTVHSGGFCNSNTTYTLYFAFQFAEPFTATGTWDATLHPGATEVSGRKAGAWVSFAASAKPLVAKVGVSFVSVEGALANLQGEIPGWDFEAAHRAATNTWAAALGKVDAKGGSEEQRVLFYTGLYHMLLSPNLFSDSNGDYTGFDGKVRRLHAGEEQFANYSDWDIYRDVVQLHALLFPHQSEQMMQSLVRDAEQSGWLSRWPAANDNTYVMGGDSSAILLSEAYAFGTRGFDTKTALKYMVKGATDPATGLHGGNERPGLDEYLKNGYVSLQGGKDEAAASQSLEYNSADFAVSQMAAALGEQETADRLLRSAQNWRKLWDAETGFIRPRQLDGSFLQGWDPDHLAPHHTDWNTADQMGFEEGSAWQYTFMLPFNYKGLFEAMGGPEVVVPKLDRFFSKVSGWGLPNYTVTNEPDFCAAYAYAWAGAPWKTQQVVDRVQRETFFNKPEGLPGNDDLGATSGVYVWNALGMYPVIPGVGGMVLGTPMFPRVTVRLGNGHVLEIGSRGKGIYVQGVTLNGRAYTSSWLPLTALGAVRNVLEFQMGETPNKSWAARPEDAPPSFDAPAVRQTPSAGPRQ